MGDELEARVEGSGTSTDRDMVAFRAALPSLMATPEGNRIIVETLGGILGFHLGYFVARGSAVSSFAFTA